MQVRWCGFVALALSTFAMSGAAQPRGGQAAATSASSLERAAALSAATDYAQSDPALMAISGKDAAKAALIHARTLIERGRYDEASKRLDVAESGGQALLAKVLRARILAERGEVPKAAQLLEAANTRGKGPELRRVRLLLGELLLRLGRRADAEAPLHAVVDEYEDMAESDGAGLADVARAAQLLRSPKDANRAFQEAERADKGVPFGRVDAAAALVANPVESRLWWAELFLDKYDPGHAEELIKESLGKAKNLASAHVFMAKVKLEQTMNFDEGEAEIGAALAQNPQISAAYGVRASMALRDGELEKARSDAQKAVQINRFDLESESVAAAVALIAEDKSGYEKLKSSVLGKNKEYGNFFVIVSEFADWEHRYEDIVAMMKEAAKIDPDDGRITGTLGLTMLRIGDEQGGLEALQRSWKKDKFNVRVYNTLNLYEKTIAAQYESITVGPYKFRFPRAEKAMLERYLPTFTGEAVASMKARYGILPDAPLTLELYESREHFSVRTSGLPNIGIQGVCFGRVVAALSPESEPFNWGNVIWHELGHVFAIKQSNYRVPRWFTEGLSEYETIVRRPEWQREMDQEFYRALKEDRIPSAVTMNRAFTHAKSAEDITIAYYASSQLLVYTVETFGMAKVRQALELWGKGKTTPDVLRSAFGIEPAAYDAQFRAWAKQRLSRYDGQYLFTLPKRSLEDAKKAAAQPNASAADHTALAVALMRNKDRAGAEKALEKALSIDVKYKDALFVSARVALEASKGDAGKKARFNELTARLRDAGGDGYSLRMLLSEAGDGKDEQALLAAYRFDPSQSDPLIGLYGLAKKKNDARAQREILSKLFVLEQHDRKTAARLLELLVKEQAWDEAVRVGQSALYIDVQSAAIHLHYARALEATGKKAEARYEYESALLGRGDEATLADAKARLAALK